MADHGLHFVARHALQQAGGDGYERGVFERTRGKGIGLAFVNSDFGHGDASFVGELAHGVKNPGFVGVARLLDHLRTRAPLGHGLAN